MHYNAGIEDNYTRNLIFRNAGLFQFLEVVVFADPSVSFRQDFC